MAITPETLPYLWLAAGAFFLLIEAFGLPGVGFLFAGLAALSTGILLKLGIAFEGLNSFAWFFGLTAFWALILWNKIQSRPGVGYNNIVGDSALISGAPTVPGAAFTVIWSGTQMDAELDPAAPQVPLAVGSTVKISALRGKTLLVTPV